ncbi:MAG: HAD-IC family P-type ATPase, partial [Bacteroidota bacterium]
LKKTVHLHYSRKEISLRQVVELLNSIGYAPAIRLKDLDDQKSNPEQKRFFYKLGVAGFAFGNIMLLSFPEYLGLNGQIDGLFVHLFGYLNILLTIPVLLYSGNGYLKSAWLGLRRWELNIDVPIAIGIVTLFARSVFEIVTHTGAGYLDSLAGLVFFLLIGKWFQQRTYHHISFDRDYRSYFPIAAHLKKGKEMVSTSLDQLKVDDVIVVKHEELIPADAVLLDGPAKIDYSFVTGESRPILPIKGEKLFAGGRQLGQPIEVRLSKTVSQSYLTQLWNDEAFAKDQETQASKLANRVGKYFTMVILLIATITLLYWLPKDSQTAINAFTAVLIIACPCAVALAIPFIFGNVLSVLGRNRFYLKNTNVIESVVEIDAVVFDKTGTLTNRASAQTSFVGDKLSIQDASIVLAMALQSEHPKSKAIAAYLEETFPTSDLAITLENWEEHTGKGLSAAHHGRKFQLGSTAWFQLPGETPAGVYLIIDGEIQGHFRIQHQLRNGASNLIEHFKRQAKVHLLSGDDNQEANLFEGQLSGENMHFQQSPHDKLGFVKKLQNDGQVMMIGDGLNDAGALKQSDVGIVITEDTNNFTPASDAILAAEAFSKLFLFLDYMKRSVKLVYGAYAFAFIYNIIGLSFAVQGLLAPVVAAILMPLSSISIALYGLASSSFLAWKMDLKASSETK